MPFLSATNLLAQAAGGLLAQAAEGMESKVLPTWYWPPWLLLLVGLFAVVFVVAMYMIERGGASIFTRLLLASVRLALVAIVMVMLYGWMRHEHKTDLPDIVVVLDDSASMAHVDHVEASLIAALKERIAAAGVETTGEEAGVSRLTLAKTLLLEDNANLLQALNEQYNVKYYLAGASARTIATGERPVEATLRSMKAEEPVSRLGKSLRDVIESQRGRPTAAIIMLTDGVATGGPSISSTADYARRKRIPLFLVGLGDERAARDIRISDVLVSDTVFVDDLVSFDATVTAAGFEGEAVDVELIDQANGKRIGAKNIRLGKDGASRKVQITFRPDKKGDFKYTLVVRPRPGEANVKNNQQTREISVRDETIRVLMVQAYPNFEFRYLKNLLSRQVKKSSTAGAKAIELTTVLQEAELDYAAQDETARRVFPVEAKELFDYDVLIFGDVDPSRLTNSVMKNISDFVTERGGGVIFIAGPRFTPLEYDSTALAPLMPLDISSATVPHGDKVLTDPIQLRPTRLGMTSPQLQLGDTPAGSLRVWSTLPPVYWMLEANKLRTGARVLAEHPTRTGADGNKLPLVSMQYVGAGKVVFHSTDETWRWRFRTGDRYFGRYWIQTIRYLSRSKLLGKSRTAEMTTSRTKYRRGETAGVRVRFFDDRLAPVRDDGVTIVLDREGGRRRNITLRRDAATRGVFEGAIANLPDGSYRAWLATPTLEGKPPATRFSVVAPPGEQARLEMDAADLQRAASISNGRFYTLETAARLPGDLPRGKQVRIQSLPPEPVWNEWWYPAIFTLLITGEWLLRKRVGML